MIQILRRHPHFCIVINWNAMPLSRCSTGLKPRGQLISKLQAPDLSERGGSLLPMGVLLLAPIQWNPISIPLARLVGWFNTPPTLSFPLKEPHTECPITNSPLITTLTHTQRDTILGTWTSFHAFPHLPFFVFSSFCFLPKVSPTSPM